MLPSFSFYSVRVLGGKRFDLRWLVGGGGDCVLVNRKSHLQQTGINAANQLDYSCIDYVD